MAKNLAQTHREEARLRQRFGIRFEYGRAVIRIINFSECTVDRTAAIVVSTFGAMTRGVRL